MKALFVSPRSAAVLLDEAGYDRMAAPARLFLSGEALGEESRSVRSLFGLWPDTAYALRMEREGEAPREISFRTPSETVSLNVRRFGAKGDGTTEDTAALQAAILCCPPGGRVLIPRALAQELRQYSAENGIRSGSVFITSGGKPLDRSNILHSMKSLCKLARVPRQKVYPHNMRHLFACQYYKAEKDLSNLADLLGHTSINTTRIYTSTSGLEHQRQIDRLGLVR